MKIIISVQARDDLTDIGDHIASDNPLRALTFIDELEERCRTLGHHPERFPAVAEIVGERVRKLTHGGYLILYAVRHQRIEILRIVHSSRDWLHLFEA